MSELSDSRQGELLAITTVMLSLTCLAITLRCWTIYINPKRPFGAHDAFAIAAVPFVIANCAGYYWWIANGLGTHITSVPSDDIARIPKIIFVTTLLNDAAISMPKFSVIFFYYFVFGRASKLFRWALWFGLFLVAGWLVANCLSTAFQCTPIRKAYDSSIEYGHCFPQWNWYLGTAITSTLTDLYLLVIPIPLLWGIHASVRRRVAAVIIFLAGYSVIIISIGRVVAVARAGPSFETDVTWSTVRCCEWVICEGPVSTISVCLPTIFSFCARLYRHGWQYALPGPHQLNTENYFDTKARKSTGKPDSSYPDTRSLYNETKIDVMRAVSAPGTNKASAYTLDSREWKRRASDDLVAFARMSSIPDDGEVFVQRDIIVEGQIMK